MRRLAVMLLAGLLVLTACGDETGDGSGTASSSSVSLDSGDASVTVEGETGDEPEVTVDGEYSVDETSVEVMSEGDGDTVEDTDTVRVNYHGVNGTTGDVFDSSFESGQPVEFPLDQVVPGFSKGLTGQKIGSRVVISVPPQDGYGSAGNPQAGIEGTDTLIFVVDLLPEEEAPEATGTIDDVDVTGEVGQQPEVSFDKPLYVDKTESQVITPGDGAVVEEGDTVKVNYVGINGRTGKEFDGNFGSAPAAFPLIEGQLIPGFLEGLVGQKLGSRVAITIPSDDGYGSAGNPQAGIEGDDTLVFVVDLIDPKS